MKKLCMYNVIINGTPVDKQSHVNFSFLSHLLVLSVGAETGSEHPIRVLSPHLADTKIHKQTLHKQLNKTNLYLILCENKVISISYSH